MAQQIAVHILRKLNFKHIFIFKINCIGNSHSLIVSDLWQRRL